MATKIIDNIEPFNDVFYKECFFNSFFPVVRHYGKSVVPFLANDLIEYHYSNQNGKMVFEARYIPVRPVDQVALEIGIQMNTMLYTPNVVEDLAEAILDDEPALIWVDCYYESIRKDTYQKMHWPHTWLVYGVDKEKGLFHIIEHNHHEYLSYEPKTISFEDTVQCYEGYIKYFHVGLNLPSFFRFVKTPQSLEHEQTYSPSDRVFVTNMLMGKERIIKGLSHLKIFINDFRNEFEYGNCPDQLEKIIQSFNQVINIKVVEKYRLSQLFGDHFGQMEQLDHIIQLWNYARSTLAKMYFSESIHERTIEAVFQKLNQIPQHEKRFYEQFYNDIEGAYNGLFQAYKGAQGK